jgi:hypothetical protein
MAREPLANWSPHLALAITGHRADNLAFVANARRVRGVLLGIFEQIEAIHRDIVENAAADIRLYSLLARGVDQIAAQAALDRGWKLVAPLPFGRNLNLAINAGAATRDDVTALCEGRAAVDAEVEQTAQAMRALMQSAHMFEIADRDEELSRLLVRTMCDPADLQAAHQLQTLTADNVALAGRIMIERSDLLIAVWDGKRTDLIGGTGHTVVAALETGTPVLVIDLANPEDWSILSRPEELGHLSMGQSGGEGDSGGADIDRLRALLQSICEPIASGMPSLARERWHPRSAFGFGIYRSIEALFGGRSTRDGTFQTVYEAPENIAGGSAREMVATTGLLLGTDDCVFRKVRDKLLPGFAWADGVSSRLSDAYRSGMTLNFALSASAIIAGIAYLPLDLAKHKWAFAAVEFALLSTILLITYAGSRFAWHRRWMDTRRLAEYLRFGPAIAILGVARPIGRWPRADGNDWPERLARDALRDAGLPGVRIDRDYLRTAMERIVLPHVSSQQRYHTAKAAQLARVHHRIDRAAEACFLTAVVAVLAYLALEAAAALGLIEPEWPYSLSKAFTAAGVIFPTLGSTLAGIRYFGDFERFAAISRVTASKLANVQARMELLLSGDPVRLTFRAATELVQAVDEIVLDEIESWQSVFGGKHLALPA